MGDGSEAGPRPYGHARGKPAPAPVSWSTRVKPDRHRCSRYGEEEGFLHEDQGIWAAEPAVVAKAMAKIAPKIRAIVRELIIKLFR